MKADYRIHGGWGDHIEWLHPEDFESLNENSVISVWGHLFEIPRIGQTLMGEFKKSFIKFEFVEVERMPDPPDMFFAKVKPIEQEMKLKV